MSTEVLEGTVVNLEPQKEVSSDPPIEDVKVAVQKAETPKAEPKSPESGMHGLRGATLLPIAIFP